MFTLTQDEFVLLSQKLNSPTLLGIAGAATIENLDAAEKGLVEKGLPDKAKQIAEILDREPAKKVTRLDVAGLPYEVLAVKAGNLAAVSQTTTKDWARHFTSYTLALGDEADYLQALETYLGFVETADSQQIRKFTCNVAQKTHQDFLNTFLNRGPALAVKRHRHSYGLKEMEMYQFNMFLTPKPENFKFKYEEGGKEILCESLRSTGFQILQVPGKNLFGKPSYKFYHLGMKKSFEGVQKGS